jgi:hypothetical protein
MSSWKSTLIPSHSGNTAGFFDLPQVQNTLIFSGDSKSLPSHSFPNRQNESRNLPVHPGMPAIDFIFMLSEIPDWGIGAICSVIPFLVAALRRQWFLAVLVVAVCILAGIAGGWAPAAWSTLILFLFVLVSPSSGTGSVALLVIVAITGVMLYAVELRLPEVYAKTGLPSLTGLIGSPAGDSPDELEGSWRVFTSPDGRKMTARVETVEGDQVTIERKDGQRFTTRLYRFSEKDQEYLRSLSNRE